MKRLFNLLMALAVAGSLFTACQPAPKEKADLVLTNGYIYTVDAKRTVAEAMAVKGDTIVYVCPASWTVTPMPLPAFRIFTR
jgi:adenine deaminase